MAGANTCGDMRGGHVGPGLRAGRQAPLGCCFRNHSIDLLLSAWQCTARARDNERCMSSVESSLHSSQEISHRPGGGALKLSPGFFFVVFVLFCFFEHTSL